MCGQLHSFGVHFSGYCVMRSPLSARQSPACPCHYWFLSCEGGVIRDLMFLIQVLSGATGGLPHHRLVFSKRIIALTRLRLPECGVNMMCALPLTQIP